MYLNHARDNLELLDNITEIKLASKIFAIEPLVIKRLDNLLIKIGEKFNSKDWVEILNVKSINRQRNMVLIDSCAFNIMRLKDQEPLDIDSIQKCLLSCGILSFLDVQFFKTIVDSFINVINSKNNQSAWIKQNEQNLISIVNSIGMLQLRDKKLLDTLCSFLAKNIASISPNLIVKFIISCSHVNYLPGDSAPSNDFKRLLEQISVKNFNLEDQKDKINFLNYVWSLCALDLVDPTLVSRVLDESFWKYLIQRNLIVFCTNFSAFFEKTSSKEL
jgi:hypothetical protein